MDLALAGAQSTKESFHGIVGSVTFRPGIASKQTRPTLFDGGADMFDDFGI